MPSPPHDDADLGAAGRLQGRLLVFATAGTALVTVAVAAAVLLPLSQALHERVEADLAHIAHSRALVASQILDSFEGVALQVASRTKAREAFASWQAGGISDTDMVAFEEPILRDALEQAQDLLGITRLDREGRPAVRVGVAVPSAWLEPAAADRPGARVRGPLALDGRPVFVVSTPIVGRDGEAIGTDTLLVRADRLIELLREPAGPVEQGRAALVAQTEPSVLTMLDPASPAAGGRLRLLEPGEPWFVAGQRALAGHDGVSRPSDRPGGAGAGLVLGHAPLPGRPMAIVLEVSARQLYAQDARRLGRVALLVAVLALVGAACVPLVLRPMAGRVLLRHDELEAQIARRTEQLQRANEELQQFASVLAHDFRTPLSSVLLGADLLADELADAGVQDHDILDTMREAIRRMDVMLNDLLRYARTTRERAPLQVLDLNQLASEALQDLHAALQERGAKIVLDPLPSVLGEETRLRQLFLNLLSNAVKFGRTGVPPIVRVTATRQGDLVALRVEDNGRGIPQADQRRIFELFTRAAGAEDVQGTGLGLALCKKIVEQHGGTITVQSIPGQGSVFVCTLRAAGSGHDREGAAVG